VFRIVTDPQMHVEIDGSGMLELAPNAKRLAAVGDTFEMDMDREPLGDVPMGKYQVLNTVTRIVPGSLLEWNVGSVESGPFGHVYGWQMTAVDAEHTEVTNYCDWSGLPERFRDVVSFPVVPVSMLERSVEKLAALVEKGA
jgi:hypothetical protein